MHVVPYTPSWTTHTSQATPRNNYHSTEHIDSSHVNSSGRATPTNSALHGYNVSEGRHSPHLAVQHLVNDQIGAHPIGHVSKPIQPHHFGQTRSDSPLVFRHPVSHDISVHTRTNDPTSRPNNYQSASRANYVITGRANVDSHGTSTPSTYESPSSSPRNVPRDLRNRIQYGGSNASLPTSELWSYTGYMIIAQWTVILQIVSFTKILWLWTASFVFDSSYILNILLGFRASYTYMTFVTQDVWCLYVVACSYHFSRNTCFSYKGIRCLTMFVQEYSTNKTFSS